MFLLVLIQDVELASFDCELYLAAHTFLAPGSKPLTTRALYRLDR